jgi:hypothetical protein
MRSWPKMFVLFSLPTLMALTLSDRMSQVTSGPPGIKITVRYVFAETSAEQTIYIRGDRRRMEYRNSTGGARDIRYGPRIASITRCDLGQMFELNLDTREYSRAPDMLARFNKASVEARGSKVPAAMRSTQPTLLIETTTVDTTERKEIFGHTARHVITTRKETILGDSQSAPQETVTDGWYIDLDTRISCDMKWREGGHAYLRIKSSTDESAPDVPKFVDTGKAETGFAVETKRTSRDTYTLPDGTKRENTATNEMIVAHLEEGPLDAALFEVPKGFRQVDRIETSPPADWRAAWISAWERFLTNVERLFN